MFADPCGRLVLGVSALREISHRAPAGRFGGAWTPAGTAAVGCGLMKLQRENKHSELPASVRENGSTRREQVTEEKQRGREHEVYPVS